MTIRISTTSKLDGIRSWSLEALTTCPGSRTAGGDLVPACQGCYATTGHYTLGPVKQARQHNQSDWKRDTWFGDMLAELDNHRYFRWFDSGDLYDLKLANKILALMQATP